MPPKGQPIMDHDKDLIGRDVHFYRLEWEQPGMPRAGKVIGFGGSPGLFQVLIFHNARLDCRARGLPPFGNLLDVLVVDRLDDAPIGVSEFAKLTTDLHNDGQSTALTSSKKKTVGELEKEESASVGGEEPDAPGDETQPASSSSVEDPGDAETPESPPAGGDVDGEPPHVGHLEPLERLLAGRDWDPMRTLIDSGECEMVAVGDNERTITEKDVDKPIARIWWIPAEEDGTGAIGVQTQPWGLSIKIRDRGGRCSKTILEPTRTQKKVQKSVKLLAKIIEVADSADAFHAHGKSLAEVYDSIAPLLKESGIS